MPLIYDPNFLDRDLGSTNGMILTFSGDVSVIGEMAFPGESNEITITYTNLSGEKVAVTYSDFPTLAEVNLAGTAKANTPIYVIGHVTQLKVAEQLVNIDLRALRSLETLEIIAQENIYSINVYGCRNLTELFMPDCTGLEELDLSENKKLEVLDLSGCSLLNSLSLANNLLLRTVDLTNCTNLSYLDATMLTHLEELRLDGTMLRSPNNSLLLIRAIGSMSTGKHLLSYDGGAYIKEGDKILTHADIYNMLMNTPDFVVLVMANHAYHPNLVTETQIAFTCSYMSVNGEIIVERVNITSENVISRTSGAAITRQSNGSLCIKYESVPDTVASKNLLSGVAYIFADRESDLVLTLAPSLYSNFTGEYPLTLTVTGTPTITWPANITWAGGEAPTIESGKSYEIDIYNKVAIVLEYGTV